MDQLEAPESNIHQGNNPIKVYEAESNVDDENQSDVKTSQNAAKIIDDPSGEEYPENYSDSIQKYEFDDHKQQTEEDH